MGAMKAVLPVFFFLLALGFTARVCRWITPQQNEGAKTIVFQVLFPFLLMTGVRNTRSFDPDVLYFD